MHQLKIHDLENYVHLDIFYVHLCKYLKSNLLPKNHQIILN